MSFETWKEEFYPIEAHNKMSDLEACEHALKKFIGTRKKNLKKHLVVLECDGQIIDILNKSERMSFYSKNCSFCLKYLDFDLRIPCKNCPLYKQRGVACDKSKDESYASAPWSEFIWNGNPEPMINLLNAVKEKIESKIK